MKAKRKFKSITLHRYKQAFLLIVNEICGKGLTSPGYLDVKCLHNISNTIQNCSSINEAHLNGISFLLIVVEPFSNSSLEIFNGCKKKDLVSKNPAQKVPSIKKKFSETPNSGARM